jgi:cytochrome P450/NADPH-cytochrome P450 reductase
MNPPHPIPQPKSAPVLGNIAQVDPSAPVQRLMQLARTYGPIFRLDLPTQRLVVVSSQQLVNEVCDEQRFGKHVHAVLEQVRTFAGDGLFTAHTREPNWGKAHRLLMPAFGPLGIRSMFGSMLDITEQMLTRWERFGPEAVVDVADQMTRLTLDTIALCAFDYRFNSFYQNEMHPFVDAMVGGLAEAGARSRRPELMNRVLLSSGRRFEADVRLMHRIADEVIAERRRGPSSGPKKQDLLARMLDAKDPVTGEGLSDENIRYQLVTFLIAGHETTSGLLSFATHLLLANPSVLEKARTVVDDVLGSEPLRLEHLSKLRYLDQVLMESLRLWPTAPVFAIKAHDDTVIGGRYAVDRDDVIMVLAPMLHRDPAVWGNDVEGFKPERFDPDAEAKLPPNAWKPFGNGQRACIGRPFAMQEALIVLSMMLQRFDLVADDAKYELRVKETLTLKPADFRIRAKRRADLPLAFRTALPSAPQKPLQPAESPSAVPSAPTSPLLVLFGSNTGSSEAFAQRIGSAAAINGFRAEVAPMDDFAGRIPEQGVLIVVTASYEGQPPDNARQFIAALDTLQPGRLSGLGFAVFGCGNRQWARTYQAIPTRVDLALEQAGAQRVRPRGEADASGDFFGAFDAWYAELWSDLSKALGLTAAPAPAHPDLTVEVLPRGRTATLRQEDLAVGRLVENRELVNMTSALARSKRHLEIELPEGMRYRTGDYLAVLPRNPPASVDRVLRRFGLAFDTHLVIHKGAGALSTLPTEYPIAAGDLCSSYVELAQPATRAQVRRLAEATQCPPDKRALEALSEQETYERDVLGKRLSVLDLLERYPACELKLDVFVSMLPSLKPRQYSISSSPLYTDRRCALTIAVVEGAAMSGQGRFAGVASSYLASAAPDTRVAVAVRASNRHFHPPASPETPLVMICAGTGLAPFRGFLQERALQKAAGRAVGPALLFFGCDHPEVDFLYRDELAAWEAAGVVQVRPAFTHDALDGVKFVQDRVWKDRADVADLVRKGAVVYVCGDGRRMAPAVRDTLARIYVEETKVSYEEALRVVEQIERERGRFVEDVFA